MRRILTALVFLLTLASCSDNGAIERTVRFKSEIDPWTFFALDGFNVKTVTRDYYEFEMYDSSFKFHDRQYIEDNSGMLTTDSDTKYILVKYHAEYETKKNTVNSSAALVYGRWELTDKSLTIDLPNASKRYEGLTDELLRNYQAK